MSGPLLQQALSDKWIPSNIGKTTWDGKSGSKWRVKNEEMENALWM